MLLYDLNLDIEKEENNERGLKLNLIPRPFYKKFSRNLWLMIKMERPSFTWHKNGIKLNLLSLDKNCLKRLELIENKIGEFKKNWYSTFENESTFQKYSDKDDLSLNTLKEFILEVNTFFSN
ncbi:hypothetical protein K502DRAFT_322684 [Neoconidiobolus thromboides FSU 785]|nr:hypothetical protein K502DRAFT_322684 [Neoconidiobolus thromboides FSU 785]